MKSQPVSDQEALLEGARLCDTLFDDLVAQEKNHNCEKRDRGCSIVNIHFT